MAWPARPQDTYGVEKLYAEEMCIAYAHDFPIQTRIARFHNVYGPRGTWKGGREKAPAAFCRKAICSKKEFEVWGDGVQTRSFMFIDDCVEVRNGAHVVVALLHVGGSGLICVFAEYRVVFGLC